MVLVVTVLVFAGFVTNILQHVAPTQDAGKIALALLLAGAIVGLHLGILGNPTVSPSSRRARLAAAALAALCALGLALFGDPWDSMIAVLTAAVLLVLPWGFGVAVIVASAAVIAILRPDTPLMFGYVLVFQTIFGVGFFVLARLRGLIAELDVARDTLRLAAAQQERLRLAQDLHDLLGLTLTAITLKAELARRLLTVQPDRSQRELRELRGIAERSQDELAAIPSIAAEPGLDEELRTAAVVLADAGIDFRVIGDPAPLPPTAAHAVALVVREATANVLRHSAAAAVTATWRGDARQTVLEIRNDGADVPRDDSRGQGHRNLRARISAVGGDLDVRRSGDDFFVTATLPVPARRRMPAIISRRGFTPVIGAVFAAEALHATFILIERPHPLPALILACVAAFAATGLLAGDTIVGNSTARRRHLTFAAISVLVLAPMLLLGDPFVGPPGVLAAAALTLLSRRVGIAVFLAIAVGMPLFHVIAGSDPFYAVWSVEVVVDHGLVLFAILQLSRMIRELQTTQAQIAKIAVDQTRLGFERELDAVLRPGLADIVRRADEAGSAATDAEAGRAIESLTTHSRRLLAEVRQVAARFAAEDPYVEPRTDDARR